MNPESRDLFNTDPSGFENYRSEMLDSEVRQEGDGEGWPPVGSDIGSGGHEGP